MAGKHLRAALLCLAVVCAPNRADADGRGDGLYARWDRGVTLSVGAGAGATWIESDDDSPKLSVVGAARLLFIDAAGPVIAGRWAPDDGQYLFLGVDIRPLFPALFFLYKASWREFWDLLLQSVSVELGAAFMMDGERSAGFSYGFSLGLPLSLPKKALRVMWLKIGARRVNLDPNFRNTSDAINLSEWTLYGLLAFDFGVVKHLGSWEPPRYRAR